MMKIGRVEREREKKSNLELGFAELESERASLPHRFAFRGAGGGQGSGGQRRVRGSTWGVWVKVG